MSACVPASVSLITDYFRHEVRGRANSVFAFGVYLGGGLSSLSLIIDEAVGWRDTILIVCFVSIVLALPILILKEPPRY